VLALLQRDRPRRRGLAGDRGLLVDSRPLEMEVVELGRVRDDDHVLAGLELRDLLPALRERDLEARIRPDVGEELRRRGGAAASRDERDDTGSEDEAKARHCPPNGRVCDSVFRSTGATRGWIAPAARV